MWVLLAGCRDVEPSPPPQANEAGSEHTGSPAHSSFVEPDPPEPPVPLAHTGSIDHSGRGGHSGEAAHTGLVSPPPCLDPVWVRVLGSDLWPSPSGIDEGTVSRDGTTALIIQAGPTLIVGMEGTDPVRIDVDPDGEFVFVRIAPDGAIGAVTALGLSDDVQVDEITEVPGDGWVLAVRVDAPTTFAGFALPVGAAAIRLDDQGAGRWFVPVESPNLLSAIDVAGLDDGGVLLSGSSTTTVTIGGLPTGFDWGAWLYAVDASGAPTWNRFAPACSGYSTTSDGEHVLTTVRSLHADCQLPDGTPLPVNSYHSEMFDRAGASLWSQPNGLGVTDMRDGLMYGVSLFDLAGTPLWTGTLSDPAQTKVSIDGTGAVTLHDDLDAVLGPGTAAELPLPSIATVMHRLGVFSLDATPALVPQCYLGTPSVTGFQRHDGGVTAFGDDGLLVFDTYDDPLILVVPGLPRSWVARFE